MYTQFGNAHPYKAGKYLQLDTGSYERMNIKMNDYLSQLIKHHGWSELPRIDTFFHL